MQLRVFPLDDVIWESLQGTLNPIIFFASKRLITYILSAITIRFAAIISIMSAGRWRN
jgi:hypothetical protein